MHLRQVGTPRAPSGRNAFTNTGLPALLLLVGALELAAFGEPGWPGAIALEALASGLLVLRRRHEVWSVLAMLPLFLIPVAGPAMDEVAAPVLFIAVALFSLGRHFPPRTSALWAGAVVVILLVAVPLAKSEAIDPTDVVFALSLGVPPYVFGRVVRRLALQQAQLEAQQAELARQAVLEERGRIARELHDVIAHSMSAMVVQSAAAQDLVRSDPEAAERLLANVAQAGREALAETGRLLHVVRDEGDELGLAPAPGLADLPSLVTSFRERGLAVDADLVLPDRPLPAGVDVSAYRLVQEALTNAAKHGSGGVRLRVNADDRAVDIRCANRVADRAGDETFGSHLGLTGMTERVQLLHGQLRHEVVEGHFVLEAHLPVLDASPEPVR